MTFDDYGQYFFALIQRTPGQPAPDWATVLSGSGIPAGLSPGEVPDASMPHYALTQQIRSSGEVAGRIFLPTATPDDLGYYSHPVSPLRDGATPGTLVWEWRDLGGPPVVMPGDGSAPPSGGGGGLTEAQVQAMIDDSIAQALVGVVRLGATIALRTAGDAAHDVPPSLLCVEGGGGVNGDPLLITARDGAAGPWEKLTVDLVEE